MGKPVLLALATILLAAACSPLFAQKGGDSLRYPISDRRGDRYSNDANNPFDLKDTSFLRQTIEYDPKTKQYYLVEKIGNTYYRKPTSLTFEEFWRIREKQIEDENFRKRANTFFALNRGLVKPKLKVKPNLFNRIFGGVADSTGKIKLDIKPQGNVDISAGYQGQNTKNPTLPENARKYGTFDFNMNTQFNMNASIGDKLKLPINYNTLANFDFQNQLKLDYAGKDDEIIKELQAGNISFANKSTLIPGVQGLFGVKTKLQFGKLFITAALANEKSQAQTQSFSGGSANQTINRKLDDYEENHHFLLAQYFRNNYNNAMSTLPVIKSQVNVLRVEVWVTNRTGVTTNARTVVGLMDLGENAPYLPAIPSTTSSTLPQNGANQLYSWVTSSPNYRDPSLVTNLLTGRGLTSVQDYEKTYARKLAASEYTFRPDIGYISLNTSLQSNDVLAVAYQYTYNGKTYQVGEFSTDVSLDSVAGLQKVMFLKLLKATSQRPNLPIWNLMMKNVYNLNASNIQRDGFTLNILYQNPSGGLIRNLPDGDDPSLSLLRILKLDRLNNNNDPQPDGLFDYVEGYTIQSQQGRIIFPVLEPFGADLAALAFSRNQATKNNYLFTALYDTIKAVAIQNYAQFDRFTLTGNAKSTSSSEFYLNAFNVPQGSVKVTAGGQALIENQDYSVDYNLGKVQILNQAIINSGQQVQISFENNGTFGNQNKGFLGLRLDYAVNKKLQLGASLEKLTERPYFTKMNYGDDPVKNTMMGLDFNYHTESMGLTRFLNKLPFYESKAVSSITAYGEGALLKPGHPPQIGTGEAGLIYIDDFEGSQSDIDLRYPFVGWTLASTPSSFPEAALSNNLQYGYNRAKFNWYQIEPVLQDPRNPSNPITNRASLGDPRVRAVDNSELFPNTSIIPGQDQLVTFDFNYNPKQRGPYNFDDNVSSVNPDGTLKNPANRWGGIMRSIDQTDFETQNIEFIEFWVQSPYTQGTNYTDKNGGYLYFNLGDISEDILNDGRHFYENGLPTPSQPTLTVDTTTVWGKAPINPVQLTQAFSTDPNDRASQDVGFDGLDDDGERIKRAAYLNDLQTRFGAGSLAYQNALKDPSNDNFLNYRDASYDAANAGILQRYKNYNNPQGNSPISTGGNQVVAATLYPDNEDLDRDNTLTQTEQYFEYKVDMRPQALTAVGQNYITDIRNVVVSNSNTTNVSTTEQWIQFRVPIDAYTNKVGNIPDFKSIRFMRMYAAGWQDSVNFRFAKLSLVRNQWRNFAYEITNDGTYTVIPTTAAATINTLAVNIEENDKRTPIPYKLPPGIERVQSLANGGVNILQNEQSMSLQVRNLPQGEGRGVTKTLNLDLRRYKKLSMFLHAEELPIADPSYTHLTDTSVNAIIRIGQDFQSNFYEITIPLKISRPTSPTSAIIDTAIWPTQNNLDFNLQDLITLKNLRNSGISAGPYFSQIINGKKLAIYGNPNLGQVEGILINVYNPKVPDGPAFIGTEVWVDELRLSGLDEHSAYAATGRVDVKLADLGTMSFSGSYYSAGWGTIESKVNDRSTSAVTQLNFSTNLELGKLLPKESRLSIPMYASISSTIKTPEYDAYNLDIKLKDELAATTSAAARDSIKNASVDKSTTTTLNFTNVRVMPKPGKKAKLWSISNFDFTYSYYKQLNVSPTVTQDLTERWRGVLNYNYTSSPKYVTPFKVWFKKTKTHWFDLIKDFNFNINPTTVSLKMDVNRQFGRYVPRIVNTFDNKVDRPDTTYNKYFTFDRAYIYRWDLTRSLNFDFTATNKARIDEPYGELTRATKDSVRRNFFKGGRNTSYDQTVILSYTLPFSKLPLTDWITSRVSYTAHYDWVASSLLAQQLNQGNVLENGATKNLHGEFDFNRLYGKSRWLRALDQQKVQTKSNVPVNPLDFAKERELLKKKMAALDSTQKAFKAKLAKMNKTDRKLARRQERERLRNERQAEPVEIGTTTRVFGKLLTMVKRASVDYGEVYTSRIPGYTDSTAFFGNNFKSNAPGLGYILGKAPDDAFLDNFAKRGLLTSDSSFNLLFTQSYDQKLNIQATLEPFREFTIDVNLDKTFNKQFQELFKDTTGHSGFSHLSPYLTGGYSVSFISFQTLFEKYDPNALSETFLRFQNYRQQLSNRVANTNQYYKNNGSQVGSNGYAIGYGQYSQDVLIPAFIAAYTNKSPNEAPLIDETGGKINSNPFHNIKPVPNWRLNFTGLSKVPALQKFFTAFTITHSYQSHLSMNSFQSALNYNDPLRVGAPQFIDTVSGNYVPYFVVPNLTITEAFEPLLGIEFTTKDKLSGRFEYAKSRQLSLSLVDYQLSEVRSTGFTFGASWRKKGFPLPFKLPKILSAKGTKKLDNDVTFKLDFSIRDDVTANSTLDQKSTIPTAGQKVIKISPSIDYILNSRINVKLFFDQQRVIPYVSSSAETVNTRAGLALRISLAQ